MSLKPIGITILILALMLFAARYIPFVFLNSDEFFIQNAEFEVSDFNAMDKFEIDENLRPAYFNRVHRVRPGVGTILAVRKLNPGSLGDGSMSFERITLWVSQLKVGTYKFSDGAAVRGFYSRGESVLPRTQCGSEILTGGFEILSISEKEVEMKMNATIGCFLMTGEKQQDIFLEGTDRFQELNWNEISLKKL